MKVLVTGGAGYIGSHACKALARAGHAPVAFDDLSTGWRDAVRFGPLVEGSLSDREALARAFAEHAPDAVMHFAARSLVGEAMADPGKYWRENVGGAANLLDAMAGAGCRSIVFSSTCATYGEHDGVELDEDCAQEPLNAYGASKLAVEAMLRDFEAAHGISHVIFRYFNVAGADAEAEIGERHEPETHLIPVMLQAVAGTRDGLTLHGTDYATRDGTCVRDYVHVEDLVDAHLKGLDWLEGGRPSRAFNLGTGTGFTVREVIDASRAVTNREVPVTEGPRRAGDATSLVSGSRRAAEELGWEPERSTMDRMIADAWRWHRSGGFGAG